MCADFFYFILLFHFPRALLLLPDIFSFFFLFATQVVCAGKMSVCTLALQDIIVAVAVTMLNNVNTLMDIVKNKKKIIKIC